MQGVENKRTYDLSPEEIQALADVVDKYQIEGDLVQIKNHFLPLIYFVDPCTTVAIVLSLPSLQYSAYVCFCLLVTVNKAMCYCMLGFQSKLNVLLPHLSPENFILTRRFMYQAGSILTKLALMRLAIIRHVSL